MKRRDINFFRSRFSAGTSLVETVLVMAVGTVLTGIVVTSMAALMRYNHRQTEISMSREQLQMLFTKLRDDARSSTAYALDIENQSVQFSQSHQKSVTYRFLDGHCRRIQNSPPLGEQTTGLKIPANFKLTGNNAQGKRDDLLRILFENPTTLHTPTNKIAASSWHLELVAHVGRDLFPQAP